jgi:uncharacterized protein DUF4326
MSHPLVVHCKRDRFDYYIGRPGLLGNPYSHRVGTLAKFKTSSAEEAIASFETYARERMKKDPAFRSAVRHCHDKRLGCWCAPNICHGEILVKLAAELVHWEAA